MKVKNFATLVALVMFGLFSSISLYAQEKEKVPEEQLGVGIELGNDNWIGAHGIYVLTADIHIGAHLGFVYDGGTSILKSTTNLLFAPYMRYYLPKIAKSLKPFGEAKLVLNTGTERYVSQSIEDSRSFTETAIKISVGGQWFPYTSVGVYGGVQFLHLGLDPTRLKIGIGSIFMGIEWFLDK
ncbi:MAG: hypothetical protein Q8M94_14200 [Ignavibacteria bacterium]|nr:hypothetical protein [Ignavibacteria bacterium]